MVHDEIKKAVENNDIVSLKYLMCDCLDGDPTFVSCEDDYEYCKSKGILFVPHIELHPMVCDLVDERYWVQLKRDFMKNPSIERMEHMREVAKILYAERIRRIEQENEKRKAAQEAVKKTSEKAVKEKQEKETPAVEEAVAKISTSTKKQETASSRKISEPVANTQVRRTKEPMKTGEEKIRRVSEPVRRTASSSSEKSAQQKKSKGMGSIVVALVVIAIVLVIIVAVYLANKQVPLPNPTQATHPGM